MRVWQYGDDINTDMLFPGKYTYTCATPDEIRPHLLEDLDPDFTNAVAPGDIIIAGRNFGCGSSREQPVLGLRMVGIRAIIAAGFARIFYRAGINQGLLLIEHAQAVAVYRPGDELILDEDCGRIRIAGRSFTYPLLPPEMQEIRSAGGLLPYTRLLLKQKGSRSCS